MYIATDEMHREPSIFTFCLGSDCFRVFILAYSTFCDTILTYIQYSCSSPRYLSNRRIMVLVQLNNGPNQLGRPPALSRPM